MADLSVRETAARAYTEHLIGWAMADDEWEAARSSTEVAAMGAALAAVAAHDGLADVLAAHVQHEEQVIAHGHVWCASCDAQIGDWTRERGIEALDATWTAHLADVVRAWLLT